MFTGLRAIAFAVVALAGPAAAAPIHGTPRDDLLIGTAHHDELKGLAGDDEEHGRPGDDVLRGGAGDDTLCGDPGDDRLRGGPGHDSLSGGRGRNSVYGGEGRDLLFAGPGKDRVFGGRASDVVTLAFGRESTCSGVADRPGDRVRCGGGYDTVYADRPRDYDIADDCESVVTLVPGLVAHGSGTAGLDEPGR
jgi:Ca2+-binding RTX toxin-like protein